MVGEQSQDGADVAAGAEAAGVIMEPQGARLEPADIQRALGLLGRGDVAVKRVGTPKARGRMPVAPKAKPERGLGHLDGRARELLHHPATNLAATYTSRYVERRGDVIQRTYVIRYAHLFAGSPMWHSAIVILGLDQKPKPRSEWTRRDRRQSEQMLGRRLEHIGAGPTLSGEVAGMFTEYADHLLRPLSDMEARHYPAAALKHEPIDLWAETAAGEGEGIDD